MKIRSTSMFLCVSDDVMGIDFVLIAQQACLSKSLINHHTPSLRSLALRPLQLAYKNKICFPLRVMQKKKKHIKFCVCKSAIAKDADDWIPPPPYKKKTVKPTDHKQPAVEPQMQQRKKSYYVRFLSYNTMTGGE